MLAEIIISIAVIVAIGGGWLLMGYGSAKVEDARSSLES